jgi:hypothetical protein
MEHTIYVVVTNLDGLTEEVQVFDNEDAARYAELVIEESMPGRALVTIEQKVIEIDDKTVYQYALDNFENLIDSDNPPERD